MTPNKQPNLSPNFVKCLWPVVFMLMACRYAVVPADLSSQPADAARDTAVAVHDLRSPPVPDLTLPPDLTTPPDLTSLPDLPPPPDLATAPDLAGLSGDAVCYAPAPGNNRRRCAPSAPSSGYCDASYALHVDRACTGAGCSGGYCAPPASYQVCKADGDCSNGTTCQLFRNYFGLVTDSNQRPVALCAPPPGAGDQFAACTVDAGCKWNLCYAYGAMGRRCARICNVDTDCGGASGSCGYQTVTFETQGQGADSSFLIRACNSAPITP